MKKILLLSPLFVLLLLGCALWPAHRCYVRVVNTGATHTRSYIVNESRSSRSLQHFFPGLAPGDTSSYLAFKKVNEDALVTIVFDSLALTTKPGRCHCRIKTKRKITIGINAATSRDQKQSVIVNYSY